MTVQGATKREKKNYNYLWNKKKVSIIVIFKLLFLVARLTESLALGLISVASPQSRRALSALSKNLLTWNIKRLWNQNYNSLSFINIYRRTRKGEKQLFKLVINFLGRIWAQYKEINVIGILITAPKWLAKVGESNFQVVIVN